MCLYLLSLSNIFLGDSGSLTSDAAYIAYASLISLWSLISPTPTEGCSWRSPLRRRAHTLRDATYGPPRASPAVVHFNCTKWQAELFASELLSSRESEAATAKRTPPNQKWNKINGHFDSDIRFWGCQNGLRGWLIDCDFRCVLDLCSCLIRASGAFRSEEPFRSRSNFCMFVALDCQTSHFVFSNCYPITHRLINWNCELISRLFCELFS